MGSADRLGYCLSNPFPLLSGKSSPRARTLPGPRPHRMGWISFNSHSKADTKQEPYTETPNTQSAAVAVATESTSVTITCGAILPSGDRANPCLNPLPRFGGNGKPDAMLHRPSGCAFVSGSTQTLSLTCLPYMSPPCCILKREEQNPPKKLLLSPERQHLALLHSPKRTAEPKTNQAMSR